MVTACPSSHCKASNRSFYKHAGSYTPKWNHQPVPRYQCTHCKKYFSSRTFKSIYRQKKPYLNIKIFRLYCSGMTQRRIAMEVGCNLKTVVRKILFMTIEAKACHKIHLNQMGKNPLSEIQFDEMESFEHTRLKPLSVALAISGDGKNIIDIGVGTLHYKGRLAALAFKKYGPRVDTSKKARQKVFDSIRIVTSGRFRILSDAKLEYLKEIENNFYKAQHDIFPNRRNQMQFASSPTRRKNVNDPLFWLNHVASRIRHDLSRMMRKTWTTTKRPERLEANLILFIAYYNGYFSK